MQPPRRGAALEGLGSISSSAPRTRQHCALISFGAGEGIRARREHRCHQPCPHRGCSSPPPSAGPRLSRAQPNLVFQTQRATQQGPGRHSFAFPYTQEIQNLGQKLEMSDHVWMSTGQFPEHGRSQVTLGAFHCPCVPRAAGSGLWDGSSSCGNTRGADSCGMAAPAVGNARGADSCGSVPAALVSAVPSSWDTGQGICTPGTAASPGAFWTGDRQCRGRLAWPRAASQLPGTDTGSSLPRAPASLLQHHPRLELGYPVPFGGEELDPPGESRAQQTCSEQAGLTGTAGQVKHYLLKD